MNADGAEVEIAHLNITQSDTLHYRGQLFAGDELLHGFRKVGVGFPAAEQPADAGQDMKQIEIDEGPVPNGPGPVELQYDHAPARFRHAGHLTDRFLDMGHVADTEAYGDDVEPGVGIRQAFGVGNHHRDGAAGRVGDLLQAVADHRLTEVGPDDVTGRSHDGGEIHGKVARSCADVEAPIPGLDARQADGKP